MFKQLGRLHRPRPSLTAPHALSRRSTALRHFSSQKPSESELKPRVAARLTKQMVVTELKAVSKLTVGGLAVVAALIASGGFVIETVKSLNPMTPPGFMVQITGADGELIDVHVQRRGDGNVTVLLDGGVGEASFDWDKVAVDVAKFAAVVSVDRPGLGFSKPGPKPRTSTQIVSEYKQLLEKLNVTGDVVLVAHGAGGYNMRQLAEELKMTPGSSPTCGGLVLVDTLQGQLS